MRILAFADWYLPGFRGGGPVRTIANLVERLSDRFEFRIVTRDHDCDGTPYDAIEPGRWHAVGHGSVLYLGAREMAPRNLAAIVAKTAPELVYLNSVFSPLTRGVLRERRAGRLRDVPVLLAPRGEFAPAALARKSVRKRVFLAAARGWGLFERVAWQASSPFERDDIVRIMGADADVGIVADVASPLPELDDASRAPKRAGELRLVFLSRIAGMKNPVYLVERLAGLRGRVVLDVWGPLEEPRLWAECEAAARRLPPGIRIERRGEAPPGDVARILQRYHAFALPTRGENFGHVVLEALGAGCPVVVSDRTPWRDLAASGAGWDLPLADAPGWERALQELVDLDAASWARRSGAARARARAFLAAEDLAPAIALFERSARTGA